jgi:hypothetical protein
MENYQTALDAFVAKLQAHSDAEFAEHYPNVTPPRFRIDPLQKRDRIVRDDSVHCFVDRETGAILKAAGWKAPAKGARGSIFDADPPLTSRALYR